MSLPALQSGQVQSSGSSSKFLPSFSSSYIHWHTEHLYFIFFSFCVIILCMKHIFETRVYYSDTDAYGVVWHGAYLRWLEKGRVDLCNMLGIDLVTMKNMDVLLPVTNMNVRYKASAKLDDTVIIETWIEKFNSLSVTFKQVIKSKESGKIFIEAVFDVVAINNAGKLYRRMPEELLKSFENSVEKEDYKCPVCV